VLAKGPAAPGLIMPVATTSSSTSSSTPASLAVPVPACSECFLAAGDTLRMTPSRTRILNLTRRLQYRRQPGLASASGTASGGSLTRRTRLGGLDSADTDSEPVAATGSVTVTVTGTVTARASAVQQLQVDSEGRPATRTPLALALHSGCRALPLALAVTVPVPVVLYTLPS
jgi:hypothetical protein